MVLATWKELNIDLHIFFGFGFMQENREFPLLHYRCEICSKKDVSQLENMTLFLSVCVCVGGVLGCFGFFLV